MAPKVRTETVYIFYDEEIGSCWRLELGKMDASEIASEIRKMLDETYKKYKELYYGAYRR